MQEHINDKTVALLLKGANITGRMLGKAMRAFLEQTQEPSHKSGKQSLVSLGKQGASLSNIEITGENIGSFRRIARKYNIDFALKRDDSETSPKWLVFFKAKDVDAITAAFNEYSAHLLKERKPSILDRLNKFRDFAAPSAPVRDRSIEERTL